MRVPDAMSECVAFLGVPKVDDTQEIVVSGTAFFVSVPSTLTPSRRYEYLVTAQHNLEKAGAREMFVRLNVWGKDAEDIPIGNAYSDDWVRHPTDGEPDALRVDLAVRAWPASEDRYNYQCLPVSMFLSDEVLAKQDEYGSWIGVGDEAVIIGLFTRVTGRRTNLPIVRIGNVAMMPTEPVPTGQGDQEVVRGEGREGLGFDGAAGRVGAWVEVEDQVLPLEICQGYRAAAVARQAEGRGLDSGAELGGHVPSFRLFRTVIILERPHGLGRGADGSGISGRILDSAWGCASTCSIEFAADRRGKPDPA